MEATKTCLDNGIGGESGISLSLDEARDYLAKSRRYGIWVGVGVWLILAGAAAFVLTNALLYGETECCFGLLPAVGRVSIRGTAGLFVLLPAVAGAVAIFIINGARMERYGKYEKQNVLLDPQAGAELERLKERLLPRFGAKIAVGVVVCILAAGALVFLSMLGHLLPGTATLLLAVGLAVFLFVTAGTDREAIDVLLNQGDYSDKSRNVRAEKIIEIAAGVYWPLATVVFLIWGFGGFRGGWGSSWMVWPVAGVLFGAFCGAAHAWAGRRAKG